MTSFLRRLLGRRDVPVDVRIARTVFRTTAALYADYAQASTAFANARVAFDSAPAEAFDIASGAYEAAERATVDACDGLRRLNWPALEAAVTYGIIQNGSEFYAAIGDRVNGAVAIAREEANLREIAFNAAMQEANGTAATFQESDNIIGDTGKNALSAHQAVHDAIFEAVIVNQAITTHTTYPDAVADGKHMLHLYRDIRRKGAEDFSASIVIARDAAIEAVRLTDAAVVSNDGGDSRDMGIAIGSAWEARDVANKLAFSANAAFEICDTIANSQHKKLSALIVPPVYGEELVDATDRLVESLGYVWGDCL